MSKLTAYTVEIYKADRRVTAGRKLVEKRDFDPVTRDYIDTVVEKLQTKGITVELHETFVTKKNLMGGKEFTERYDTPYFCSPASESYWSM
jgi:phosphotransacetylase